MRKDPGGFYPRAFYSGTVETASWWQYSTVAERRAAGTQEEAERVDRRRPPMSGRHSTAKVSR